MDEHSTDNTRPEPPPERVGHFEIIEELGRGGMGIVYRARDTKLGREVALKCPHRDKIKDFGTRERFLREAKTASRLSHAHIVPIHEILEHDGLPWLAMDLVVGHSLRQLLEKDGPPPVRQIVRYAEQLTDALRVAHEHHVLHRDITPNNVFIHKDGHALLGDFGLATWYIAPGEESAAGSTATALTATGAIMGTNGYMAPEQSLGRPVDFRSDIFSLGTVLYEMCIGKAAFKGQSGAATLDAVLHAEPPPAHTLNSSVPPELSLIIQKAMAKEPDDRYDSAAEMLEELSHLRRWFAYTSATGKKARLGGPRPRLSKRATIWVAGTAVALVMGMLAVLAWSQPAWIFGTEQTLPRLEPVMRPLVTWPSNESESRLAPNGRWVSFISDRDSATDIWIREVAGGKSRRLTHGELPILSHVWSPASDEVAYLAQSEAGNMLLVVPAPLGGTPRLSLAVEISIPRLIRWTAKGIYFQSGMRLGLLDPDTGKIQFLLESEMESFAYTRQFNIDQNGRKVVFGGVRQGQENLWVANLESGLLEQVTNDMATAKWPLWFSDDTIVYSSNRAGQAGLWLARPGRPRSVQVPLHHTISRPHDVSDDGARMTVEVLETGSNLWRLPPGSQEPIPMTADSLDDLAPDVRKNQLVFQRTRPDLETGLSFFDASIYSASLTETGIAGERLLEENGYAPRLSADGRWISFLRMSNQPPTYTELWIKNLQTLRSQKVTGRFGMPGVFFFPAGFRGAATTWSPEGATLYFVAARGDADGRQEVQRFRPGVDQNPEPVHAFQSSKATILDLSMAPDGHSLACMVLTKITDDSVRYSLVATDLNSNRSTSIYSEELPKTTTLHLAGWLGSGQGFLVTRTRRLQQGFNDLQIFRVASKTGTTHPIADLKRANPQTVYLDADEDRLYLTVVEDNVHNLTALSLTDGSLLRLTRNRLPGITFSGLVKLSDGSLCYARQEMNSDIWIVDLNR